MSTGLRASHFEAMAVAMPLVNELRPACHSIAVAGSLRRNRPDVGDIELVAVPRIEDEPDGLFDARSVNRLTETVDALIEAGQLASHPDDPKRGERYSKLLHPASGLQVDLFSATTETLGLIFLIRTGPASYSQRFVTELRKRGLHVGKGELHRGGLGCGEYVCEVIPTPTEVDVYNAARWPFIKPEHRA